jgi:hypothetical protein
MFGPPRNGDVILAVTDGGDNESVAKPADVIDTLQRNGLRLFALWPPLMPPPYPAMIYREDFMTSQLPRMIAATGGEYLGPATWLQADRTEDRERLDKFYAQMVQYYRLDFQLPESIQNGDEKKLEVRDIKSKFNGNISYPRRLAPCSVSGGPP